MTMSTTKRRSRPITEKVRERTGGDEDQRERGFIAMLREEGSWLIQKM
jgi:hypothetical protein